MRRSAAAAVVVCAAMAVAACWAAEPTQATTGYRIGPKDLLEIKVFEVPELNIERRVGEDGSLNLPLIGEVPVQGLTDIEVADRLKAMLEAKYVQRASVTVQVRDFRSKPISVIGAVRGPGNLAFSGRWTLIEALTAAGGLTDQHSSTIYVLRRAENGLSDQIAIDSEELLVKANPDVNIPIVAGDLINVPGQVEVTVFCLGEIKTPGAVNFKSGDRITVLTTIARAGGLTERASRSLRIKRREASGKEVELKVDFKRILSGKDPDVALQNGDVIVIKESLL